MEKICSQCDTSKLISFFPTRKSRKGDIQYRTMCKDCYIVYKSNHYFKYSSKYKEDNRILYIENRDKILLNKKNSDRKLSDAKYRRKNKENIKIHTKRYLEKSLKNDLFKLMYKIRSNISQSFCKNGYTKRSRTFEILGCTYENFKVYIEDQFKEGMSWKNHGEWHFDHIKPISLARSEEELYELNRYTNFQPLWVKENLTKGNRYLK